MERLDLLFQDRDITAVFQYIGGQRAARGARGLGAQRRRDLGWRGTIALRQPCALQRLVAIDEQHAIVAICGAGLRNERVDDDLVGPPGL